MKSFKKTIEKARPFIQMSENEAKELWNQAKNEKGIIVEIGTYLGGSAIILESGGGNVYTIDINETPDIPRTKFIKIIGKSSDIGWGETIDLLFIDGDHQYDSVREDLKKWLPRVKVGGKVVFHDYDSHSGVTLTVHRAIEDKLIEPIKKAGSLLVTIKS